MLINICTGDKTSLLSFVVFEGEVFSEDVALEEGVIAGAAGANSILATGSVSLLSQSVVAGDMLCLALCFCTC